MFTLVKLHWTVPKPLIAPENKSLIVLKVNSTPQHLYFPFCPLTFLSSTYNILIKYKQENGQTKYDMIYFNHSLRLATACVYFQHKSASGLRSRFLASWTSDSFSSSILKPLFLKITDILSYLNLLWILSEKPCNKSCSTDPFYANQFPQIITLLAHSKIPTTFVN